MVMSNETDILIVGDPAERFGTDIRTAFRHWQVYSVHNPGALHGRKFRTAYVTALATEHTSWPRINAMLVAAAELVGGEVRRFSEYQPPVIDSQEWEDTRLLQEIRRSRHPHA